MNPRSTTAQSTVRVVLFSGGRGSGLLSRRLVGHPRISLTLAINGYDDGASTGRIRRLLGDCLGPSDFRKNASRLARHLGIQPVAHSKFLDLRLPSVCPQEKALASLGLVDGSTRPADSPFDSSLKDLLADFEPDFRRQVAAHLARLVQFLAAEPFRWDDCSLGNLVFAGCYLEAGRQFNTALGRYCALLGLPDGLIENATDGTDAHLVGLDADGGLLASEAAIVGADQPRALSDIFLLDRPLTPRLQQQVVDALPDHRAELLQQASTIPRPNPRLLEKIARADLVIYAPGTQYSSLFPTYLTAGLGAAIARNLKAIKVLITNIEEDAETSRTSAVELIAKAVYYLREKDRCPHPLPCLVTHYLINDPDREEGEKPYVPLGRLENLEDPRLARIGRYQEAGSARHNAEKVLTPFIESILEGRARRRLAICMMGTASLDKINQSILEMMRAGAEDLPLDLQIFYHSETSFDASFAELIPFALTNVHRNDPSPRAFLHALEDPARPFDYAVLFDSAGMYKGEDIVNVLSLLNNGRLDAVWGSRRLSIKDIHQSYRRRYRHNRLMGAISYVGSHLLSLAYLLFYGRYISDTLSGVQAVRATYLQAPSIDLAHPCLNFHLLSLLLRHQADVFETPVQYFPAYPDEVEATRPRDGLRALGAIIVRRFTGVPALPTQPPSTDI